MTTVIRVGGVPEHFNFPWRLALAAGAFEASGVVVEYSDYPGGTGAMADALNERDIDVALMLTEGAVLDIVKGSGNRLVKVYVETPLTWGIHVAGGSDITTVESIEGRPVAISRYGSRSHLIAIVDALERGFPIDSLRFVVVDNLAGARTALADGSAAVFLWEKHMTQPLVDSGEFRRVGERAVPWPAFVVSAHPDVLREQAMALKSVLDTVALQAADLQALPDAAEQVAAAYGITVDDAGAWLAGVRWGQDYTMPAAALERVLDALKAQGAIDSLPPSLDELWHPL